MKQTDDPLMTCYGINNRNSVTYFSVQKDNGSPTLVEIEALLPYMENRDIVLFLSLQLFGKKDEVMPVEALIRKRYNLHCKSLSAKRMDSFSKKDLLCAVAVEPNQLLELVNVLITISNNAFAVVSNLTDVNRAVQEILACFKSGVLVPRVLAECCSVTLANHACFLHVLQGYDGYSINLFKRD